MSGYRDLADLLRDRIQSGALPPGARFPSERDLQQAHSLSRDTVRLAVAALRAEGLIVVRHGHPTRVRDIHPKQPIDLAGVVCVDVRMPTPAERDRLGVGEGVPVFVVACRDGSVRVLPGDRWRVEPSRP